jgi:hypothetical protein
MNTEEKVYKFALEHALKKIEKDMVILKDSFPFVTVNGKWELCEDEDWDFDIFKDGKNHLSIRSDSQAGILLHGCFHKPKNVAIDNSLIFGDYYYIEALTKLING